MAAGSAIEFRLDPGSGVPTYLQLVQQVEHALRLGYLKPGDQIVLVAVTSAHRNQSFLACEFLMDYLKTQAPFWKKEAGPGGTRWVDARIADDAALARWGIAASNVPDRAGDTPATR